MKRRVSICMLAGMVLTMVGLAPAAAQTFEGEVLLATPSLDEVCGLLGDLGGAEGLGDLEEMFGGVQGLEGFEPEPVDDGEYAELSDALQAILDDHEDAMAVTAATDGQTLTVSVTPDITQCEGLEDLDVEGEVGSGTFLIQPSVDEFCGLIEDTLSDLDDLEGDLDEGAAPESGEGMDEDLGAGLEGFLPTPVDEGDRAPFDAVGAALGDALDGADEADEASVTFDGDTLVVSLAPGIDRCDDVVEDVPETVDQDDQDDQDQPEEIEVPSEVPSGLGVSATGPTVPALMAAFGLVLVAIGGGLARRRTHG